MKPAAAAGTVRLGDLTVNRMALGAMRATAGPDVWREPPDRDEAKRLLKRAVELGVNFLDTSDSYGPEVSESIIAEALYPYPPGLVIGTKGGLVRPTRHRWDPDGRPEHLRRALDGSLKRLRLERIDLYQFHAPDPSVPFAESIGALADLKRAGKVAQLGVSNVSVRELDEARRITPIVAVQNQYNLMDRAAEDVLAACEHAGIAFIPWYPLGAGSAARWAKVKRVAARHGATRAQLAIAWCLKNPNVSTVITGASRAAQVAENMRAVEVVRRLSSKVLERIENVLGNKPKQEEG